MNINSPIKLLLFFSVLSFSIVASAQQGSYKTSMQMLDAFFNDVTTLKARFEQKIVDESGITLEVSRGVVYLSRPNKFRWDYYEGVDVSCEIFWEIMRILMCLARIFWEIMSVVMSLARLACGKRYIRNRR